MKKKIAILHIATGRYTIFWPNFYESFQEYFLPDHQKTFFLFTDDMQIDTAHNVVKIQQENLGWPYITLLRFDFFLRIEEQLKEYDYIFFFNANMMPVTPIGEEVLPSAKQELALALHPMICFWPHQAWTYERRPDSRACIPAGQGDYYVMGSFIGGTREGFLRMCHVLSENIQDDLRRNIIALWHDESHLNHYIVGKNPLVLPPNYITMEGSPARFDAKIVYLEKGMPRYGGRDYMRGIADLPATPLKAHPQSLRKYIHRMYFKKKHFREWFREIFLHKETPQIVELDKGLGIQMFQYAFACALRDQGKSVAFDQSGLFISPVPGGGGKSGLCQLNTDLEWTHCSYFSRIFLRALPLPRFFQTLHRKAITNFAGYARLKEPGISYAKMLLCMPERLWYLGHFADERYFVHLRPLLQDHFRLKNKMDKRNNAILKDINSCVSVAVSLPCGAEISAQMQKYYQDAMQYISERTQAHFFVFGKNHGILKLDPALYSAIPSRGKQREYIDLELMRNCTHHIIGQSYLAWWGAWLADHEEKIVIAPKYFSSGFVKECTLPAEWITM